MVAPVSVGLLTNSNAGTRQAGGQLCDSRMVVHDSYASSLSAMTQSTGEGRADRQAGGGIPGAGVALEVGSVPPAHPEAEHHLTAARKHVEAATHHYLAAALCEAGDPRRAREHADHALEHSSLAHDFSMRAHSVSHTS